MTDRLLNSGDISRPPAEASQMLSQLEAFGRPEDIPGRIILLEHVLTLVSRRDFPSLWAELHIELGNALRRNYQGDKRVQLMRAITCFDIALTVYTREETPTDWAKAQQNRGIALSDLAWLLEGTEEQVKALRTAIICYDAVLTVSTHEAAPFDWAEAQNNKATALSTLAWLQKNMGKAERVEALHAALGCYDAALTVFTRETAANWAMAVNNKGNALTTLAGLLEDAERVGKLQAAIICYDNALLEQRCEPDSADWAATQYNKGNALRKLAALSEGTEQAEKLRAAVTCYNNVLLARSQGETPANWITMQDVKANMLKDLVELLKGKERVEKLREVIACYDAVLTIATHAEMPTTWAKMQHNKGIALRELAGLITGSERERALREAIACFEGILLNGSHELAPANRVSIQNNKGASLRELAGLLTGSERGRVLREAIACFDAVLPEECCTVAPTNWAATQSNKGSTLRDLAELLTGSEQVEILHTALACYDAALAVYTREGASVDWAATLNNKAEALCYLTWLITSEERAEKLREAIACYDAALAVYTPEAIPTNWTTTQNNKGIALYNLSRLLIGVERVEKLREAVACFDAVLLEQPREEAPVDWARIQHNKGKALCDLAGLLVDTERAKTLREAIACFDAALLERRREVVPVDWAKTQNNKGIALRDLAGLLRGEGRAGALRAAIASFDAVLLEQRREKAPTDWATAQNNKSAALRDLAATLGLVGTEQATALRVKVLRAAIACCDEALTVYTREDEPSNWAAVQNNKGNALRELAEVLTGAERRAVLQAAIVCYDAALLERNREVSPAVWAMLQNNKGVALRDLAGMSEGNERAEKLREAIACYDAVLSIYTRQVLPADHRRIAQSVGMMLFKECDWKSAARYLSTALDALDDLFTLEVTTYGRKSTLKAGGDLAAHLAYALIRTDQVDAAWQAIEALERGRARATGEAIAYQEAQVAVAKQLTPDILERFREVSNRLVTISLVGGTSDASRTVQATDTMSVVGDAAGHTAMAALNMQLAGYEEAREARAVYDGVVAEIRGKIPDFLKQGEALKSAVELLAADECLVYIASTPVGALVVLVSGPCGEAGLPIVERWWDERLTSMEVTRLLVGSPGEEREQPEGSEGLLAAQSDVRKLGEALRVTMQALGVPDGVLARLATYCRAAGLRRLVLVPCGLLGLLPLHAALVPTAVVERSEPLLDVVQVSYTPSARIWAACRRRVASSSVEVSHTLVVSDPQPQASEVRLLPYAKDEGQVISRIVTSNADSHVFVFKDETATLPDILNVLQEHGDSLTHVHFACHGLAKLTDPQTSGLLLAYGARLMTRDLLDPTVIHFERLRLAVLSACQTALSGTELPDEVVGLPSGWLQAGAMGVLASLWPVSDNVTVALMKKFYELHLLDRLDPEPALWLAQRWFRRLPTWRQNCLAAGAVHAAEGPEASEVVHELALIRGETMPLDDLENLAGVEIGSEAKGNGGPDDESAAWKGVPPSQYRRWEHARHWAAFAIYGA